ncbi:MAG: hypothetical protein ABFS28_08610 [Bacteroidota bacterium]
MKRPLKPFHIIPLLALFTITSCINLEEEPILMVRPTVKISAHIKNARIYATAQINVNPDILVAGNLKTNFEYSGDLAIYNTRTGNIIDVNAFSGGGQSQVYTVAADTASHESLVVIASGKIEAWADIGSDGEANNDKLISTGGFHEEAVYHLSEIQASVSESLE